LTGIPCPANHGSVNRSEPTADVLLEDLVASIHAVLGDDLLGCTSMARPSRAGRSGISDLDLVAVRSAEVTAIDLAGLDAVHRDVVARHPEWTDRSRLSTSDERRSRHSGPAQAAWPSSARASRSTCATSPRPEWVQNWYLVRETGVVSSVRRPPRSFRRWRGASSRPPRGAMPKQLSSQRLDTASPGVIAYAVLTCAERI